MEGKTILVTGASRGIGREICLQLASLKNVNVALADVNVCEETINLMKEINPSVETLSIICDISKSDQVEDMVNRVVVKFGRLDGAVNNAGILGQMARIGEYDESMFSKMMDINIKGTWLCIKYQVKQMEKQGKGEYSIVNISSIAGVLSFPYNSGYSAVKHAILGITKSAAAEYGALNIRCNAVLPGASETAMLREYLPPGEATAQLEGHVPLKRVSHPSEIAKPVLFLLSPESSYITGQSLIADGGLTIV
ncbi:hypothetical protein ACTFIZ_012457 [Dictyostelium cf. discoideum]